MKFCLVQTFIKMKMNEMKVSSLRMSLSLQKLLKFAWFMKDKKNNELCSVATLLYDFLPFF